MKSRLQRLWDETVPQKGPSPRPRPRAVLRRVRQGMAPTQASARHRNLLRRVVVIAVTAALLLLGGMALAANQGELGEHNVLQSFFYWGETAQGMETLVNTQPVTVSDENYTLTLTSSIADRNDVYFTLEIRAKTQHAREVLAGGFVGGMATSSTATIQEEFAANGWRCKPSWMWGGASNAVENFDPETGTQQVAISMGMGLGLRKEMAVRFEDMEEGLWLRFPVKPLSPIKRSIRAEGQGCASQEYAAGNKVYLKHIILTPLSVSMKFTTDAHAPGIPVIDYLWKDGHVSSFGEMHVVFPSGSGGETCNYSWQFKGVQDISQIEAVIFEGMAYPLDGGKPYPYTGPLARRPFSLSARENQSLVGNTYPFFALCEGLGAAYSWDPETGTATATYRDVTLTFTLGSKALHVKSATMDQVYEMEHPPLLEDGELWVDQLEGEWNIQLRPAYKDLWGTLEEDGRMKFNCFVVYP